MRRRGTWGIRTSSGEVTRRFLQWADREGLRFDVRPSDQGDVWASRIERYETNPAEQADMSRWVTRLTFKLVD
jgi:hypothetical protein